MKRFRDYILGVLTVVMILAIAFPAMAASYNQNMSVTYRDIKIAVNGTYFTPKDAQGRMVEPFIYEGTTYLPVRATAEAVGYNVTWDNNTSTVYLTNGGGNTGGSTGGNTGGNATPQPVNLVDTIPPYEVGSNDYYPSSGSKSISMGGVEYKNSFEMDGNWTNSKNVRFNLGGKYTLLSGIAGPVDNAVKDCVLEIYGDGVLLKSIDIIVGTLPTNFSVDVTGVSQLTFSSDLGYAAHIGVAELKIQ